MMNTKMLLCALLGIICAQVVFIQPVMTSDDEFSDEAESDGDKSEEEEDEIEDFDTDLNCVLFGDAACDATCTTVAYLYGTAGSGTCNPEKSCKCEVEKESTLKALWNQKFENDKNSDKLLSKIVKSNLGTQALEILKQYPRTNADSLAQFQEKFPNMENKDLLKARMDTSPVSTYIDDQGNVDETKLRDHITTVIQEALKEKKFTIKDTDYKTKIDDFLKKIPKDDQLKEYITDEILKTDNASLKKFLGPKFAKEKYSFDFSEYYSYDLIPDLVAAIVNDQFIKFVDSPKKPALKKVAPKKTALKKPAKSPSKKIPPPSAAKEKISSPSATEEKTPPPSAAKPKTPQLSTTKPKIPSPSATKPKTPQLSTTKPRTHSLSAKTASPSTAKGVSSTKKYNFNAPGVTNFVSINNYTSFHREWKTDNSKVRIDKEVNGSIRLKWQVDDLTVNMSKQANGQIDQTWNFGEEAKLQFAKYANSSVKHIWKIGNQQYQYSKGANGSVRASGGISDQDKARYEANISAWCRANGKFFPYSSCVIYEES